MRILFTRNNTIVSRLIRRITGEPISHVAIQCGNSVTHSNFLGIHTESLHSFCKHSTVIYSVDINDPLNMIHVVEELSNAKGSYDFGAMLFLGLRYAFPKWMPKQNLWQSSGAYLCTEFVTYILDGKQDSMITPYKLYERLSKQEGL